MTKANANEAAKPKRPERSEEELERMRTANERRMARHEPVTASVKREADGRLTLDVPHDDHRGWLIRLGDAMGSRSDKFAMEQLQHLLATIPAESPRPDFNANSMLAATDAVRPENEIEGMLAVQMAATHQLAMTALARSATSKTVQSLEANTNLATKMLRTYTTQLRLWRSCGGADPRRSRSSTSTSTRAVRRSSGTSIAAAAAPCRGEGAARKGATTLWTDRPASPGRCD